MLTVTAQAALTELLALMRRSYPQYLKFAHPYARQVSGEREAVLNDVAADQSLIADRAMQQLDALGVVPQRVEFPMEFTDSHDLSMDYLIERAIRCQELDLLALSELAEALPFNQSIRSLVDEAKGMTRGHLESLEECRRTTPPQM